MSQENFEKLKSKILQELKVKTIGGMAIDGLMLALFLEHCVKNINEEGDITVPSATEATMDLLCLKYMENAKKTYTADMNIVLNV